MNREEELFQRRLLDLAQKADRRGIVTFTDFLNLNELNIYHQTARELFFVKSASFGGYESAERQIIAFIPDALSYREEPPDYPIACVRISARNAKYSDMSHRDILGAVLNLGIERGMIGDILVGEAQAHIFCLDRMQEFLCSGLTRVKHTQVDAEAVDLTQMDARPKYERIKGTVASVRLDSLLALAFGASRSRLAGLIEGKKVFVNAKLVTSSGYSPKEADLISVRGLGKFRYLGAAGETRRGRIAVELEKYI